MQLFHHINSKSYQQSKLRPCISTIYLHNIAKKFPKTQITPTQKASFTAYRRLFKVNYMRIVIHSTKQSPSATYIGINLDWIVIKVEITYAEHLYIFQIIVKVG